MSATPTSRRSARVAFAPALPLTRPANANLTSAFLPSRSLTPFPLRPSLAPRFAASLAFPSPPSPQQNQNNNNNNNTDSKPWQGMRRVVHVSAMSLALFAAGFLAPPRNNSNPAARLFRPDSAIAATTTTVKDTSTTGDAEAAAMTLGAVTIGGLVMRAIVTSRRDEEAEKRRLEAECKRLEQEENERALRAKRKKMEMVEGATAPKDDELLSDLMKRVQSLENGENAEEDDNADASMRHTPIPDRGMGSAVLDRPGDDVQETDPESVEPEPELAKPEELDMLNRMWNLSSGDTDAPNRPTPSS